MDINFGGIDNKTKKRMLIVKEYSDTITLEEIMKNIPIIEKEKNAIMVYFTTDPRGAYKNYYLNSIVLQSKEVDDVERKRMRLAEDNSFLFIKDLKTNVFTIVFKDEISNNILL